MASELEVREYQDKLESLGELKKLLDRARARGFKLGYKLAMEHSQQWLDWWGYKLYGEYWAEFQAAIFCRDYYQNFVDKDKKKDAN
jgi:hypothetical protein